jgi:hypothetical protein
MINGGVGGGVRPADERGMSRRDVELVNRLEANGLTLLAAAVAERLLRLAADEAREPAMSAAPAGFVLRNGGWPQDEAAATDPGDRGRRTAPARAAGRVATAEV